MSRFSLSSFWPLVCLIPVACQNTPIPTSDISRSDIPTGVLERFASEHLPQQNVSRLKPSDPLPSGYSTHSLLLLTSAEWLSARRAKDLRALKAAFESFGDAIGPRHAAIWLSGKRGQLVPDIDRAKNYADKLRLSYNEGPFIVVGQGNSEYPTSEVVVVKLGGISPDRIVMVLNVLEQDLRRDAPVRRRVLLYEEIKQRVFSILERSPEAGKTLAGAVVDVLLPK